MIHISNNFRLKDYWERLWYIGFGLIEFETFLKNLCLLFHSSIVIIQDMIVICQLLGIIFILLVWTFFDVRANINVSYNKIFYEYFIKIKIFTYFKSSTIILISSNNRLSVYFPPLILSNSGLTFCFEKFGEVTD